LGLQVVKLELQALQGQQVLVLEQKELSMLVEQDQLALHHIPMIH